MSTQTLTEEVHLVSIISIAEDRLQSNFRNILSRLRFHDQQLIHHNEEMKKTSSDLCDKISNQEKSTQVSLKGLAEKVQKCFELISSLTDYNSKQDELLMGCQDQITKNQRDMEVTASIFDEKVNVVTNETAEMQEKVEKCQNDIYKLYEELLKKEDSTQVLKIIRELESVKDKIEKNEKELRMLEHKSEKMQIYNQKNERNQSKKEIELMKEIEDKIKKEVKSLQKYASLPNISNVSRAVVVDEVSSPEASSNTPVISETATNRKQSVQVNINMSKLKAISIPEEDENALNTIKYGFEKVGLSKINQRMEAVECKLKALQSSVNVISNSARKTSKPERDQDIKQKINQIKPELIKIWAKCDTIDDRISFNERKLEEKAKMITTMIEGPKEKSMNKIDEKIKSFQMEFYSLIKEIKSKLDGKVNTHDYEKYCVAMDERIRQLSDIVFLKSDKLEVKKALLFLESKIKEIILVISEDEENEKDALLTKKQLKCMSCDKEVEKLNKLGTTTSRGNWDNMPYKQNAPEHLGKFGMTGFGSLSKKLKKLDGKQLPVLRAKNNNATSYQSTVNPILETDIASETK